MKKISIVLLIALTFSCVSKKKYLALEQENGEIKSELLKTIVAKEDLEAKFDKIQSRVDAYNTKLATLKQENDTKLDVVGNVVMSNATKSKMRETLKHVDANKLSQAKTLKDSMNLAVAHNLQKTINESNMSEDEDFAVNINETVVMISIADNMLFNSGSYRLSSKADTVLQKLADVINSEPSLDVMVEGHTDARTIKTGHIADNWDLSVLRSTSVVRKLQEKYNVAPEKLIAAGRSSYQPVAANDSSENRSKNRRTRIIILPNIDKFFALMADNNEGLAENNILD
ncbi:OmpA family protein [Algibacter amylolyticus]|uniref:OmpA family protein n=1 Tax=Algibacter amylolyticus TaxID=1608400 RepID=A0A5M7BL86_9FLAO|nr:OmpA family protein [Algibacter amylolyticus]KAA5827675.1 OmpA family protein [Algibacter amylolyticus]MBB5266890.1 chemotaxis protein MotB [Algibacter amylolyticus]TSJ81920.1 OmpA family protein [Algibacter amylolyticus]